MTKEEMMAIYADAAEPMAFVRVEGGSITSAWANWSPEATEIRAESDPDLISFRGRLPLTREESETLKAAAVGAPGR